MSDPLGLAGFFVANLVTAGSGAIFTPGAWYEGLRKPRWRPPNWLFAPAWAVLFCMIAASGWLVWRQVGFGLPIAVYALNLALNAAWSALFFGLRRPDLALYDLVAMWLTIVACIVLFAPVSAVAAWLLVPYLAWTTFAGALNATMWRLNGARPA
ncbi:TspO/MBR family protein [Roseomonas sp. CCTCC AB2023176]|uniref:TspO/MBR family protein n=1 Tax=Roseomonas sp. CCTCC AB2023176 TaxID=3342640 RepID=UPI0035DA170D